MQILQELETHERVTTNKCCLVGPQQKHTNFGDWHGSPKVKENFQEV